jgi:CheY-like chemotaxis protein
MSHELRSPLSAMLGFAQAMNRDPRLPEAARDDVRGILESGQHLHALIHQVLDWSKIEAGHFTLSENDFDLWEFLSELSAMFERMAVEKNLSFSVERDPALPRWVRADSVRLRQVLINLVGNAIKFTDQGTVKLSAAGAQDAQGAQGASSARVRFEVHDTGPGIAPEERDQLFGAFVQGRAGRAAKEGSGLGLAISRGFVELMGGTLELRSSSGGGTVFGFDVPLALSESRAEAQAEPPTPSVRLDAGQPEYRILVVDDHRAARTLLVRLLTPIGFQVREAADGQQALETWETWSPHVICMDERMPGLNGRDAARRIKSTARGKDTLIVALTASSFEEEREELRSDGYDAFLLKPYCEAELLRILQQRLGVRFAQERAAHAS